MNNKSDEIAEYPKAYVQGLFDENKKLQQQNKELISIIETLTNHIHDEGEEDSLCDWARLCKAMPKRS